MDLLIYALLLLTPISQGLALYGVGTALWKISASNKRMKKEAARNDALFMRQKQAVLELLNKVREKNQ